MAMATAWARLWASSLRIRVRTCVRTGWGERFAKRVARVRAGGGGRAAGGPRVPAGRRPRGQGGRAPPLGLRQSLGPLDRPLGGRGEGRLVPVALVEEGPPGGHGPQGPG